MKKLVYLLLFCVSFATAQDKNSAEAIVQKQVEAYNARNLEAFLANYSDDVVFYSFPKEIRYTGIEKIREAFGNLFRNNPNLHCTIEDRIVSGNIVVDHEKVIFQKGNPIREFIIMYKINDGKIIEVYSLKR